MTDVLTQQMLQQRVKNLRRERTDLLDSVEFAYDILVNGGHVDKEVVDSMIVRLGGTLQRYGRDPEAAEPEGTPDT